MVSHPDPFADNGRLGQCVEPAGDEITDVHGACRQIPGLGDKPLTDGLAVGLQCRQNRFVLFGQGRTAGGAVDNHRIGVFRPKARDHILDAGKGQFASAGEKNGNAAASLTGGDFHIVPHGGQNTDNGIADLGVQVVGGTAIKVEHFAAARTFGRVTSADGIGKGARVEGRQGGDQGVCGHPFAQDVAEMAIHPGGHAGRSVTLPRAGEHLVDQLFLPADAEPACGFPAHGGEDVVTGHAAGTGGGTGPAQQAGGENRLHVGAEWDVAPDDPAGELDLAPGADQLVAQLSVYRAGAQAKSAAAAAAGAFGQFVAVGFGWCRGVHGRCFRRRRLQKFAGVENPGRIQR